MVVRHGPPPLYGRPYHNLVLLVNHFRHRTLVSTRLRSACKVKMSTTHTTHCCSDIVDAYECLVENKHDLGIFMQWQLSILSEYIDLNAS